MHIPLTEGELVYEKENVRPTKLTPKWKREPVKVVKRCKSPKGSPGHTYVVERRDGSQHRRNLEQSDFPVFVIVPALQTAQYLVGSVLIV